MKFEDAEKLVDAKRHAIKTGKALDRALRIFETEGVEDLRDSWRDDLLRTLDDIDGKAGMGRALLTLDLG
jgi:hypothetical protein